MMTSRISQKHKHLHISRTKQRFLKLKNSLLTHQGLLYGKYFCSEVTFKRDSGAGIFLFLLQNFWKHLYTEDIGVTASALHRIFLFKTLNHLVTNMKLVGQLMGGCLPSTLSKNNIRLAINFLKIYSTKIS